MEVETDKLTHALGIAKARINSISDTDIFTDLVDLDYLKDLNAKYQKICRKYSAERKIPHDPYSQTLSDWREAKKFQLEIIRLFNRYNDFLKDLPLPEYEAHLPGERVSSRYTLAEVEETLDALFTNKQALEENLLELSNQLPSVHLDDSCELVSFLKEFESSLPESVYQREYAEISSVPMPLPPPPPPLPNNEASHSDEYGNSSDWIEVPPPEFEASVPDEAVPDESMAEPPVIHEVQDRRGSSRPAASSHPDPPSP